MIKRKGKFLTFCFSLFPGAGHMYLGLMKQGLSLMLCFFGITFISIYLNIGAFALLLPVLFFYSFFDVLNKNSLSDEDFYALKDDYLFYMDLNELKQLFQGKFRPVLALILIIIGGQLLLDNCYHILYYLLPDSVSSLIYETLRPVFTRLPQTLIALVIIAIGIRLIRGKKTALGLENKEDEHYENS